MVVPEEGDVSVSCAPVGQKDGHVMWAGVLATGRRGAAGTVLPSVPS